MKTALTEKEKRPNPDLKIRKRQRKWLAFFHPMLCLRLAFFRRFIHLFIGMV